MFFYEIQHFPSVKNTSNYTTAVSDKEEVNLQEEISVKSRIYSLIPVQISRESQKRLETTHQLLTRWDSVYITFSKRVSVACMRNCVCVAY